MSDINQQQNNDIRQQEISHDPATLPAGYVKDWLTRLRLLDGVPLENLISNEDYLPTESIRFFCLDRNWTDSLVEGALHCVGATSSQSILQRITPDIQEQLDLAELDVDKHPEKKALAGHDIYGFILRSSVVSGYPGMEITLYRDSDQQHTITPLKLQRLTPDILLCLYPEKPASIKFFQGHQNKHFGLHHDSTVTDAPYTVTTTPLPDNQGKQTPTDVTLTLREGATGVLNVSHAAQQLRQALELNENEPLPASVFALQMTTKPGVVTFNNNESES